MGSKRFSEYVLLREGNEPSKSGGAGGGDGMGGISTKISLGDNNDYVPFEISDDPKSEHYGKNKNLAPIVRAFKQGANWGWSKDDSTGTDKPVKINGKKLFLSGGAVRDHLMGKKARNVELATNASPDEVYHLLKQNGFEFVNDQGQVGGGSGRTSPNKKEGSKQFFWVKKANKNGRPFTFGLKVNEDEFELDVFMKTPRGNVDKELESGTHGEDAAGRDFTLNGMYILLSADNGPNKELYDFYGGMHHLKSGRVAAIGDMGKKLKEDPSRILRYVRMLTQYGDPSKISDEDKSVIQKSAGGLSKLDRKLVMDEFKKGMDKDDVDTRGYLKTYRDLGLLDQLFPGKAIDTKLPKELSEIGDKHMPLAWMLRMNSPEMLDDLGMDPKDQKKIGFLIKSLTMSDGMDEDTLSDLLQGYTQSGVSSRKLKEFATKVGGLDQGVVDAFLGHAKGPRVNMYETGEDGSEQISGAFADLTDPFTGQPDQTGVEKRKKQMELEGFKKQLKFMRPA